MRQNNIARAYLIIMHASRLCSNLQYIANIRMTFILFGFLDLIKTYICFHRINLIKLDIFSIILSSFNWKKQSFKYGILPQFLKELRGMIIVNFVNFKNLIYVKLYGPLIVNKWNESGFRPPLCTYRLNWARRTSWGWWDDWDDTVLQTQDSKFEPWRSEAEHATSRSRRLPTILNFTRGWGRNNFVSWSWIK